jgi:hypothetical protein
LAAAAPPAAPGGSSGGSSSAGGDVAYAYAQVLSGQLLALALNLSSFGGGLPRHAADELVVTLGASHGLPRATIDAARAVLSSSGGA